MIRSILFPIEGINKEQKNTKNGNRSRKKKKPSAIYLKQ